MTQQDLIRQIHEEVCALRNLQHAIMGSDFHAAYRRATDDDIKQLMQIIRERDTKLIRAWIRRLLNLDIYRMNILELRKRAAKMKIKRYPYMTKDELLGAIEHAANCRNA